MLFQAPKILVICYIQKHYKTNIVSIAKNTLCTCKANCQFPTDFMSLSIHSLKMLIEIFHKTTTKPLKEESKKMDDRQEKKEVPKTFKIQFYYFSSPDFYIKRNHYTIIFHRIQVTYNLLNGQIL